VAPVLDPATRTAEIEIEVPNGDFRLKPGMYARMSVTIDSRKNATLVPKSAVVDYESKRGVFTMTADNKALFQPIEIGIEDESRVEARNGVAEGAKLVTSGASSLRDGDTLVLAGQRSGPGGTPNPDAAPAGGPPAKRPAPRAGQ
jgi:membrane fusion protein (multidrug efflux system)